MDPHTSLRMAIIKAERERFRRVVDVLLGRFLRQRTIAHDDPRRAKRLYKADEEELRELKFLREQLRVLIDSEQDPKDWPDSRWRYKTPSSE